VSVTKFKRGLKRARYEVRSLTHTLHIPPARPEFYDGPQQGWLRDCLDGLPFLQSLKVSGVAFFDHEALRTVRRSSTGGWERKKSLTSEVPVSYGLRLLVACGCENTTTASLTAALANFPHLMYLDLSSTTGVRNHSVLGQITCLEHLQVLKLKNCGLRDDDMQYLRFSDTNVLRSLDIRDNHLTDVGISTCLKGLTIALQFQTKSDRESWHISKGEGFEALVESHLTTGFAHRAFIEDHLPIGLSHLYVAGNDFSIEGLTQILNSQTLRILDCGSHSGRQAAHGLRSPTLQTRLRDQPFVSVLNLKLITQSFENLTYLRIHHSIITESTISEDDVQPPEKYAELDGASPCYEIDSVEIDKISLEVPPGVVELDDTSTPVELLGDLAPQFELHGDSVSQPLPSSSIYDIQPTKPLEIQKVHPRIHRKPLRSVITNLPRSIDTEHWSYPSPMTAIVGEASPFSPTSQPRESPISQHRDISNEELIEEIASRRRALRSRTRKANMLLPSMLPHLRTLILTDVPLQTRTHRVPKALTDFVQECAEEEALAALEATRLRPEIRLLERHEAHAVRKAPRTTFALQSIVLEMSSSPIPDTPPLSPGNDRSSSQSIHRNSFTKSSTEDADSEMFMSATEMDFTFFGDDDCGLLVTEGRIDTPCSSAAFATMEKMLVPNGVGSQNGLEPPLPVIDVIGEVSAFRKRTKAAFEANVRYEGSKIERALLGQWSGVISVVRRQS
jgi:hypothetical protein